MQVTLRRRQRPQGTCLSQRTCGGGAVARTRGACSWTLEMRHGRQVSLVAGASSSPCTGSSSPVTGSTIVVGAVATAGWGGGSHSIGYSPLGWLQSKTLLFKIHL